MKQIQHGLAPAFLPHPCNANHCNNDESPALIKEARTRRAGSHHHHTRDERFHNRRDMGLSRNEVPPNPSKPRKRIKGITSRAFLPTTSAVTRTTAPSR